jgi:hypothetical protein
MDGGLRRFKRVLCEDAILSHKHTWLVLQSSSTWTQGNNCCTCIDIFSSFRNLKKLASQSCCNDNIISCGILTLFY